MSEHYPRIRIRAQSGGLLVREGMSFSFYMRGSHQQFAPQVLRTLEAYRHAVGPQALCRYYDEEGEAQPLDEAMWELTRRELLESSAPVLQLADDFTENRYRFEYWGKDLEAEGGWDKTRAVCAATFWLPTEFLEEHGPERVRELAMKLAAPLPLCSGYGGLVFNAEYHLVGVRREVARYCFRYPGIDVYDSPCHYSWAVGTRVRGPHWLTFVGQPALGELSGAEALRSRLHSPATMFQEMEGDKVLITLGAWPEAGDTERSDTLPAYRELARVLEPCLFFEPDRDRKLLGSVADSQRWERRFLD